jgi:hypothetical protein
MRTNSSALKKVFFLAIIACLNFFVKSDVAMIEVYNSLLRVNLFYTSFWPNSISANEFSEEDMLNFSGKICNANTTENIMKECFNKYENYSYEWVNN